MTCTCPSAVAYLREVYRRGGKRGLIPSHNTVVVCDGAGFEPPEGDARRVNMFNLNGIQFTAGGEPSPPSLTVLHAQPVGATTVFNFAKTFTGSFHEDTCIM